MPQCAYMSLILKNRIMQPIFVTEYILSPVFAVFIVILCFDDEYAIDRYYNMINLGAMLIRKV